MKQVILIHGGNTFDSYEEYLRNLMDFRIEDLSFFDKENWKMSLKEKIGDDFLLIAPHMPNKNNAKYLEWKIWFEKILLLLENDVILVGHSLGAIFLVKYLSENIFPNKIIGTFLVASPFGSVGSDDTLADFEPLGSLQMLGEQGGVVHFFHSKDDTVVPFTELEKFKAAVSGAYFHELDNRQHFNQKEFPELVDLIKSIK